MATPLSQVIEPSSNKKVKKGLHLRSEQLDEEVEEQIPLPPLDDLSSIPPQQQPSPSQPENMYSDQEQLPRENSDRRLNRIERRSMLRRRPSPYEEFDLPFDNNNNKQQQGWNWKKWLLIILAIIAIAAGVWWFVIRKKQPKEDSIDL